MMTETVNDFYPTIEGNESNFVDDYIDRYEHMDKLISFKHGEKCFEYDTDADFPQEWYDVVDAIVISHIDEWARLYYALSLEYNPIWNVDGTETQKYGTTLTTSVNGEQIIEYDTGDHVVQSSNGSRTNTSTDYSHIYPEDTRKESNHNESVLGSGTDTTTANGYHDETTNGSHTDTVTIAEHTDTLTRGGNIGVTMTQQLLDAEWKFRQKSFFNDIFETILLEGGLLYE